MPVGMKSLPIILPGATRRYRVFDNALSAHAVARMRVVAGNRGVPRSRHHGDRRQSEPVQA